MKDNIYKVTPLLQQKKRELKVEVPGSKSITNRALLLAALAEGTSVVKGILFSDDSRHFLQCLKDLGFSVTFSEEKKEAVITGCGGKIPKKEAKIYVGSAGTAARFLTALLGMSDGTYEIQASEQMKARPMDALFDSLKSLGAEITYLEKEGYLPVKIGNRGICTDHVCVDIEKSSQFLSALLISSVILQHDFTIEMTGEHGKAYVELTAHMMKEFGGVPVQPDETTYFISKDMKYLPMEYQVEPDLSAACYFYAMAPLLGWDVCVSHVTKESTQGDLQFAYLMEQAGCRLEERDKELWLLGNEGIGYHGFTVDMGSFSDQTMTMAAVAVFADTPTTITGISHIRFQESNRILAIITELERMGIHAEETSDGDGIIIYPGMPKPAQIETYDDHRMAMAFSLIGLRADGIEILNPNCCRKTFENYFEILDCIISKES